VTLRRKSDAVGLAAGLIVFALSGAIAARGMVVGEAGLFVAINSLTDWLYYVIWPLMQFGVFLTIPILVVIALVMRRARLAAAMAIGGFGVYLLALVAKGIVDRGRPASLLASVEGRETFVVGSLGFPSGHAAVAAALTVVVMPYLSGRWRYVPITLLAIVLVGRPYVAGPIFRSISSAGPPSESLRGAQPT
jgi:undecaprenyl-diphosphatase